MESDKVLPFITREQLAFSGASSFALVLQLIAHTTQAIEVRGMTKEGAFTFSIVPAGDSSLETFTLPISDIPIQVSVTPAVTSTNNTFAHASLHLSVNGNRMAMLAQGIISILDPVAWPHQVPRSNIQQFGPVVSVDTGVIPTGEDFNIIVPDNQIWELISIKATFTADANAANRTLAFTIEQIGGARIHRAGAATIQANETHNINFVRGGTTGVITADEIQEIAIPTGILLPSGSEIYSETASIQVGDQWDDIEVQIRRLYQPVIID